MCSPDFFGAVFIQGGSSAMTDIMLVDDEVLALEYLKNMVDWERNGYHVVGCATSGKKALELFDRTHPQIVISDIRMPGTDGHSRKTATARTSAHTSTRPSVQTTSCLVQRQATPGINSFWNQISSVTRTIHPLSSGISEMS